MVGNAFERAGGQRASPRRYRSDTAAVVRASHASVSASSDAIPARSKSARSHGSRQLDRRGAKVAIQHGDQAAGVAREVVQHVDDVGPSTYNAMRSTAVPREQLDDLIAALF